ncbi:MAG TPA: hypothetical protein VIO61_16810 [Anaerolineaceae bacterium]
MSTTRRSFLKIEPGEQTLVFTLGLLLAGNAIVRQVTGIVAVSGFLSSTGGNQVLLVMLVDYLLVLVFSALQSLIVDRFSRPRLMATLSLVFALVFILVRVMFALQAPAWLNYAIMYILAEQQVVFFPLIFWVMANDACNMAQAKRLFPVISGFGFAGKLIGIGIAMLAPQFFVLTRLHPEEILTFNALVYLLLVLAIWLGLRRFTFHKPQPQEQTWRANLNDGWEFVRGVPSFHYLMFGILGVAIAYTIIEFRFLVVTDAAFTTQASYQQFYSLYRLGVTLISFILQSFLTSRLTAWIKLKNVYIILPVLTLTGALLTLLFPAAGMVIGVLATLRITRDTVDETAGYALLALVPEERRGRVSTFMDSYLPSTGIVLACLLAGTVVLAGILFKFEAAPIYLGLAALAAAGSIWAVLKMRSVYEKSLLDWRLKRRHRASSVLDKLDL